MDEQDVTLVLVGGADLEDLRAENVRLKADVQVVLEVASYMAGWCGEPRTGRQDEIYYPLLAHLETRLGEGELGRCDPHNRAHYLDPKWDTYLSEVPLSLRHRGPTCEGCGARMDVAGVPWCDRCVAAEAAVAG